MSAWERKATMKTRGRSQWKRVADQTVGTHDLAKGEYRKDVPSVRIEAGDVDDICVRAGGDKLCPVTGWEVGYGIR
jgi:hypothetical protein